MSTIRRLVLGVSLFAVLLGGCGGGVSATEHPGDAGHDATPDPIDAAHDAIPDPGEAGHDAMASEGGLPPDSGMCEGTALPGEVPVEHRATAVACPQTPPSPGVDAGTRPSCNVDSDCTNPYWRCTEHMCGSDACLVDADCPSGNICVCNINAGVGLRAQGNVCAPASCQVDSDCGTGQYCAPSRGYCGSVDEYHCTSPKDACVDAAKDCAGCGGNSCSYSPVVGYFVCATSTCNG